jgi:hypothetical protein
MALTMPFRRQERFPALQQAKRTAETQARQLVAVAETQARQLAGAVEQHLPMRRREPWYARMWAKSLFGVAAFGVGLALAAAFMARQRLADAAAEQDAADERGLASTRTEAYDAHRAEGDDDADSVQQAAKESFPASDAPVWGSGPDVPVIRQGEHKDELPYQR